VLVMMMGVCAVVCLAVVGLGLGLGGLLV